MHGFILRAALVAAFVSLALVAAAPLPAAPPDGTYKVTALVSDVPGAASVTDPNLVNGWDSPVAGRARGGCPITRR